MTDQTDSPNAEDAFGLKFEAPSTGGQEEVGGAAGSPTAPEEQPKGSEEASGPDLSFLDDEVADKLRESLTQEQADLLKPFALRQADYTRKTQEIAAKRREFESLEERAQKWDGLLSDEGLKAHILSYGQNPQQPQQPEVPDVDPLTLDGPALSKYIADVARAAAQGAIPRVPKEDEILQKFRAEQEAPIKHANALATVADEWVLANGVSEEIATEAMKRMVTDNGGVMNLNAEQVIRQMPTYTQLINAQVQMQKIQSEQQSTQANVETARAASPRGGQGNVAPDAPSYQDMLNQFEKQYEREPDAREAAEIKFKHYLRASGKTQEELDAEYNPQY